MKKFWKMPLYVALGALMTTGLTACSDNDNNDGTQTGTLSEKETVLKEAITPYINHTVIATYKNLADATITLNEKCEAIQTAFANGTLAPAQIREAGEAWKSARKYWELSEAFLYGAASDYNIDPHIDSWPLDKASMEAMLNNPQQMAQMSPDYVGKNLGYGLLGFHAIEYMLFQLNASETESQPRDVSKFTTEETIYLSAIAGDLRNQCIRLEASWAGMNNVTTEKQDILTGAELEPSFNYGESMLNAGVAGSKYVNYTDAAQELIQGCIDIADEVGQQKIGRPATGTSEEDKNYIESPYSLNSITDFADNILSIRNAYEGSNDGDKSVSDFIASVEPDTDREVKEAIENAITAIRKIQEPFAKNATSAEAQAAVKAVGTDLVNALEKAAQTLSKY